MSGNDEFQAAVYAVVNGRDKKKYPDGMNATEVTQELKDRAEEFGLNADFILVPDVRDKLESLYGKR